MVADSTSVNLFKVLAAALELNPDRRAIVSERDNFPTDLYMAQGLIAQLGNRHALRLVDADEIAGAIDADTAVVMLTHVNYKTGAMHDMAAVTKAAHDRGALMVWDLAHSAGAVPVDVNACARRLRGRLRLQVSQRRARRARLRLGREAPPGALRAAAVGLARPCSTLRLRDRLPPGRRRRALCLSARRRCCRWWRSKPGST